MADSIQISKEVLPSLEDFDLVETLLGDPQGCLRQFRNENGLHVREYADYFEIHQDKIDPRSDPIGHLIHDSPETIVSFGAASLLTGKSKSVSFASPLGFLLIFLSLNTVLRKLKLLFF